MAYQFPRRVVSSPTSISVVQSTLAQEAASMTAGEFRVFIQPSLWTRTQDPREPTASEGIAGPNYRWAAPTEQGDTGHGLDYTIIDWGGKICYDSVAKQVMWAANGANPGGSTVRVYSWQYSKYSVYHEFANPDYFGANVPANSWTQERGIKGTNEGADPDCIVHLLGNNCIDVTGRRFFKKKFRTREILVRNLTTGAWHTIPSPSGEADSNKSGAMEFVPGRGASGMLWGALCANSGRFTVYEIDPDTGGGSVLIASASLGDQDVGVNYAYVCAYNPRAFGGDGGVLVSAHNAHKLTVPASGPPTVYHAGTPVVSTTASVGHRICRDPTSDGWLHFVSGNPGKVYRSAGNAGASSWVEIATMPQHCSQALNRVVCPIDEYGVVWIITSYLNYSGSGWSGGQNGHQAWLFKPPA